MFSGEAKDFANLNYYIIIPKEQMLTANKRTDIVKQFALNKSTLKISMIRNRDLERLKNSSMKAKLKEKITNLADRV